MTLHTVPLPGTGHVLAFIINALRGWVISPEANGLVENSLPYWQRIVEVFKYAYAKRTGLGDADFLEPSAINPVRLAIYAIISSTVAFALVYSQLDKGSKEYSGNRNKLCVYAMVQQRISYNFPQKNITHSIWIEKVLFEVGFRIENNLLIAANLPRYHGNGMLAVFTSND